MIAKAETQAVRTVITQSVLKALTSEELDRTVKVLQEKSKTQDPDNPDLWTCKTATHEVWAVLDRQAGLQGEDVLTILFPSDY